MSYAIIRNAKYKASQVNNISRHNERKNENYSNKDIDKSRTELNYHLKQPKEISYEKEFNRLRQENNLKGNLRLTGSKQSNIMCELMITSDNDFFKRIGTAETKRFFESSYDFACKKCGEKNIVSAVVHMDEMTPHMHLTYIPVVKGLKKGQEVLKINSSEFWKGFNSYGKLQDDFYSYVKERGFELDRGEVKEEKREHLTVEEYKIETKKIELKQKSNEMKLLEKKIVQNRDTLKIDLNDLQDAKIDLNELDYLKIKKSVLGGKITLLEGDYNKILNLAKKQIKNSMDYGKIKDENSRLKVENAEYKKMAQQISGKADEYAKLKKEYKVLDNKIKALNKTLGTLDEDERGEILKVYKEKLSEIEKPKVNKPVKSIDFQIE